MPNRDDSAIYRAIVNDEGQYSICPTEQAIPAGWKATGSAASISDCLAYIKEAWTDMRPLSLRAGMAENAAA